MMRLCVGQNSGCLTRVWHSLWSWLKLMRSVRAAVVKRTGIEIKPKVRCPFQTVEAIQKLLRKSFPGSPVFRADRPNPLANCKVSRRVGRMQGEFVGVDAHVVKEPAKWRVPDWEESRYTPAVLRRV